MHRYNNKKTSEKSAGLITANENKTDNISIYKTKITKKQKWEKITISIFQATNLPNLTRENLGNLKRETESLLIAAQNNAIRTM